MTKGRHLALATQTDFPWRTTIRTVFQAIVALAAGLPLLINEAGVNGSTVPGIVTVLAVAAAITRIMALPFTEQFLRRFVPFLAAAPKSTERANPGA